MDFVCIFQQTNKQTNYHCMILIDIVVVLSNYFGLITFIVTYDCDVNSHLFFLFFFFTFSAFSPKFGKLFGEVSFRQGGFSAKWLFGEVVSGKVSCIGIKMLRK